MKNLFDNTETAFAIRSDSELERAFFLFKLIKSEPLVKIGTAVTKFALKSSLPVEGLIRSTVFDHFCGGVSENDCLHVIDKMYDQHVYSVLDYSVEGKEEEEQFESALEKTLSLISFAKEKTSLPFAVFKPTGFGRLKIYKKISEKSELSEKEKVEWNNVRERFNKISKACYDNDVPLLIDAEESWMQDAADDLCEEQMEKYNREKVIVYNTLQLYRHDRLEYLKGLHGRAKEKGVAIIAKIPLDSGWLTGKYDAESTFTGIRSRWSREDIQTRAALVNKIKELLGAQAPLSHMALRFCLAYDAVSTVIPGTKNQAQLEENLASLQQTFSSQMLAKLEGFYEEEVKPYGLPW